MKLNTENQRIFVSGRLWHEVHPKVNVTPFIYALNDGIDLSKYGEGLKKFYFTFLVVLPTSKIFQPYTHYSRKKKEADVSVQIPYEKVAQATEEETIRLMEEAYLKGIDNLGTKVPENEFDLKSFKKDVEAIFCKEKWYEIAEAA